VSCAGGRAGGGDSSGNVCTNAFPAEAFGTLCAITRPPVLRRRLVGGVVGHTDKTVRIPYDAIGAMIGKGGQKIMMLQARPPPPQSSTLSRPSPEIRVHVSCTAK
jgi:hypothetical protein